MAYQQRLRHIPHRHDLMPKLYQVVNHPLVPPLRPYIGAEVYVGYMKTDSDSMASYRDCEKSLKCPPGTTAQWEAEGLLQMHPGNYLFLRDPVVSNDPVDDVLAVMVTGPLHHDPQQLAKYESATQNMLGTSRAERTPDSTAFEDTGCARRIRGKRAYGVGAAVQQSRSVVAPSASLDQKRRNMEEYQEMIKDLVDATAAMLVNVQSALPEVYIEAFVANKELTGQPSIGNDLVLGTSSVQVNISAAGLSAGDNRLAGQLGDFGSEHFDRKDSPDHFTTMFSNPDIPLSYLPGAFLISQLGVFALLNKYVGVTFSGRRLHVGTAPTPPLGVPPAPWAYRHNTVWYAKEASVNGTSRFTLASLPAKKVVDDDGKKRAGKKQERVGAKGKGKAPERRLEATGKGGKALVVNKAAGGKKGPSAQSKPEPLYITPEMINLDNSGFVSHTTNRATFARSGHIIMDAGSEMNFMGRSLYLLNLYVLRQLPASLGISIDPKQFMQSITFKDDTETPIPLLDWPSAPNIGTVSLARKTNQVVWASFQQRVRRFIPHASTPASIVEVDDSDIETEGDSDDEKAGASSEVEDGEKGLVSQTAWDSSPPRRPRLVFSHVEIPIPRSKDRPCDGARTDTSYLMPLASSSKQTLDTTPTHLPIATSSTLSHNTSIAPTGASVLLGLPHAATSKRRRDSSVAPSEDSSRPTKRLSRASPSIPDGECNSSSESEESDYPFLNGLTTDLLFTESDHLSRDFERALSEVTTPTPFDLPKLLQAYDNVVKNPVAPSTPGFMRHLVTQLRSHQTHDAVEVVHRRFERYSIILADIHMWYWVDVTIKQHIRDIVEQPSRPSGADWLSTAVDIAEFALRWSKSEMVLFDPATRPGLLSLLSVPLAIPIGGKRYMKTDPVERALLLEATTHVVQSLLISALDFPSDHTSKERKRAWVMGTIADAIGPDFLATCYAWETYTSFKIKDFILDKRLYRSNNPDIILPFTRALGRHPIILMDSNENWVYQSFRKELNQHRQHISPLMVAPPVTVPSSDPGISSFPGLDCFLRGSLQYLGGTLSPQAPLYGHLHKNLDFLFPFREKAPSRVRFTAEDGPFSASTIQTDAGIYSAILFRGLTYNSPFSRHPHSPMVFSNFGDWQLAVATFKESYPESRGDPRYFCKPNAYGQTIVTREIGNAEAFWNVVQGMSWTELVHKPRRRTFRECLSFITNAKLRGMGSLCNYLLVCDLHYAGVCDAPVVADIADAIFVIKGGSYTALATLGLVTPGSNPPRRHLERALLDLQSHVVRMFTEEEREEMGWDLICLEHSLCKYSRAVKQNVAE